MRIKPRLFQVPVFLMPHFRDSLHTWNYQKRQSIRAALSRMEWWIREHTDTVQERETTGKLESIRFVPAASASYVPLKVKVSVKNTPEQVSAMIDNEIRKRGITNIYRIRITGEKKPEYSFEMPKLKEKYRIAEIRCEAEPQYDFEALFEEHQQDMIGYFISSLRKNHTELSDIDRTAMYYGIDALIKTSSGKERS